jgi:isocitrate dehydrogenase
MSKGDFYASEKSHIMAKAGSVSIEFVGADGQKKKMKEGIKLKDGEIIDASFLSVKHLREFYEQELTEASKDHLMVSLHLKVCVCAWGGRSPPTGRAWCKHLVQAEHNRF